MRKWIIGLLLSAAVLRIDSLAQPSNPLIGSWQRFSRLNLDGTPGNPPSPQALLIFSPDGAFAQIAVRSGRGKVNSEVEQLTRTELLNRFKQVEAAYGTYKVFENKLSLKSIAGFYPHQAGMETVGEFRLEGNTLVLAGDPGTKAEARYRRSHDSPVQPPEPLVGTWRSLDPSVGAPNQPASQTLLLLSMDGSFAQLAIPSARAITRNDFEHMTREELVAQFGSVQAGYGTYTASGDKLRRQVVGDIDPNQEGKEWVQEFHIEGDLLVLRSPGSSVESRFRRAK